NRVAIEVLKTRDMPVLLPWAGADPIAREGETALRRIFKNCAPPLFLPDAGHFIQEDAGEEVAGHIRAWLTARLSAEG
ncbi:MAG TPA: hypothetical protein VGA82_05020, partial [Dehalococcoidales bacterium]